VRVAIDRTILKLENLAAALDVTSAKSVRTFRTTAVESERLIRSLGANAEQLRGLADAVAGVDRRISQVGATTARLSQSSTRTAQAFSLLSLSTQQFTGRGQRAASAAVAIGFGLEGLARGGAAADTGIRQALRAVASLAAAFGTQGLIVSGVAAATAAVIDLFDRSRREMEETTRTFEREIARMVNEADAIGLQQQMQKIFRGDPTAGDEFGGALRIGLTKLEADLERAKLRFEEVKNQKDVFGFAKAKQDVIDLLAQVNPLRTQINALGKAGRELRGQDIVPRGLVPQTITADGPLRAAKEAAERSSKQLDEITARVRTLLDAERQVGDIANTQLPQLPAALVRAYNEANALLDRQKDKLSEVSVRARALIESLNQSGAVFSARLASGDAALSATKAVDEASAAIDAAIRQLKPFEFNASLSIAPPKDSDIVGLKEATDRVIQARGLAEIATFTGSSQFAKETEKDLRDAELAFKQFAARAAAALLDPSLSADDLRERVTALADAIRAAGGPATSKTATQIAKLGDNVMEVANGARGLVQVSRAVGAIGDAAAESAEQVITLVSSVAQLAKGLATGDLGSIVSGAAGAIGSLLSLATGQSAAEREALNIQKENNERVRELTRALDVFSSSVGRLSTARLAARNPQLQSLTSLNSLPFQIGGKIQQGALDKQLKALGLTFDELKAVANDLGITLVDSTGKLVKGAMQDFGKALEARIKDLTQFGDSLDDQRAKAALRQRVLGQDLGAQGDVKLNLDFLASLAPDLFKQFFAGIDIGDADAVQEALRSLTRAFLRGEISADEFGKLLGKGDLESIILGVQDGLDGLREATNAATEALLNIPAGLKLEALRFDNTAAVARAVAEGLSTKTTTTTKTPETTAPITGRAAAFTFTFDPGSIVIQAGTRSGTELAGEVLSALQQQARARWGDSTRWPEVN